MRRLVLATTNKGKIREYLKLLRGFAVEIVGLEQYPGLTPVAEIGHTFLENAVLKAKAVAEQTKELTLADDSGLEVDALGGEPGIYSARYGQPGWNDRQRYEYLLQRLQGVESGKRQARFRCVIALYDPAGSRLETAEGTVEGRIATAPQGEQGFGYDPVFYLPELGRTFAELPESQKNLLSHRALAVAALKEKLSLILGGDN
ncbi:MAG TPA: XTP/dITP diphosphatase [Bacillota bacterium]